MWYTANVLEVKLAVLYLVIKKLLCIYATRTIRRMTRFECNIQKRQVADVSYPVDVTLEGLVVGQAYSIVATPSTTTGAASESDAVTLYRGIVLLIDCFLAS